MKEMRESLIADVERTIKLGSHELELSDCESRRRNGGIGAERQYCHAKYAGVNF